MFQKKYIVVWFAFAGLQSSLFAQGAEHDGTVRGGRAGKNPYHKRRALSPKASSGKGGKGAKSFQVFDTMSSFFADNSVAVPDTFAEAKIFCEDVVGQRLCTLEELCPNRGPSGFYPSQLGFSTTVSPPFAQFDADMWIPYEAEEDDGSGCIVGGVPLNRCDVPNFWVQAGTRGSGKEVCKTHCEVDNQCPSWGITDSTPATYQRYIVCCD